MATLESIVLPLAESRALAERGIKLDPALVWAEMDGGYQCDENGDPQQEMPPYADVVPGDSPYHGTFICPAPTLGELLDAIRAKVGNPLEERTIILSQDGHLEAPCCAGARSPQGEYQIAYNDTDLLAAYALLMEVAK